MKSMLVIETPKDCWKCPMRHDYKESDICALVDDIIYNCSSKPDWCPLIKLPDKYEIDKNKCSDTFYEFEFEYGYNQCIDDILKETEHE